MIIKWSLFYLNIVFNSCVCYDFYNIKSDNVHSNILVVLCVSNTSEFHGLFADEFQFDENRILEVYAYDCYYYVLTMHI